MAVLTAMDKKETSSSFVMVEEVMSVPGPIGKSDKCGAACTQPDCRCEGFGSCIGRKGHLRLHHQCHADSGEVKGSRDDFFAALGQSHAGSSLQSEMFSSEVLSDEEIPQAMMEDALSRLQNLDDWKRFDELEKYGRWKHLLANELWKDETFTADPESQTRSAQTSTRTEEIEDRVPDEGQACGAPEHPQDSKACKKKVCDSMIRHKRLVSKRSSILPKRSHT